MKPHGVFLHFLSSESSNQLWSNCGETLLLTPVSPYNLNTDTRSNNEDITLDYKGAMVEKKDRVRVLVSDTKHNIMTEESIAFRKNKASLINMLYHEVHSEHRFTYEDIGDSMHDDG